MDTEKPKRRVIVRKKYSDEVKAAARAKYEVENLTMPAIAEQLEINLHTVKMWARRGKWDKTTTLSHPRGKVAPPNEVMESAALIPWIEIAHAAQRAPAEPWSTWLFQGGRGAGKTRAGAEWLAERAQGSPHGLFALVGRSMMCAK